MRWENPQLRGFAKLTHFAAAWRGGGLALPPEGAPSGELPLRRGECGA
jgi:hypothetical protein